MSGPSGMKFIIAGLGSMGKRRIRNLQALGHFSIIGFDPRADRRLEAEKLYGIRTVDQMPEAPDADALLIATPPAGHGTFLDWAIQKRVPVFMELNVVLQNLHAQAAAARAQKVLIVPSCTFLFHPAVDYIRGLLQDGPYGKVTGFVYHSGNYLPDWHPWEKITDFFVSSPETSGCRELLSFELHWLCEVFGFPEDVAAKGCRSLGFGLAIDDVMGVQLLYSDFIGLVMIDTVSRYGTRMLTVNLEKAQIRWQWEDPEVRVYNADTAAWTVYPLALEPAEKGYNENLTETMYRRELSAFINELRQPGTFPFTLERDIQVLHMIEAIPLQP